MALVCEFAMVMGTYREVPNCTCSSPMLLEIDWLEPLTKLVKLELNESSCVVENASTVTARETVIRISSRADIISLTALFSRLGFLKFGHGFDAPILWRDCSPRYI